MPSGCPRGRPSKRGSPAPRPGGTAARRKALLDFVRPLFALYVGGMGAKGKNFYNALVTRYGYEAEAEKIQELYRPDWRAWFSRC